MSDFIRKVRGSAAIGYILCIVFGIIICIWPGTVLLTICRIAGLLLLLLGIFRLIVCIKDQNALNKGYPLFVGLLLCVLGIWILSAPGTFLKLIPIVIGVLLIYHGVKNIYTSVQGKRSNDSRWWISLIIAVLSVIFGIILMRCAFLALEIGMIFIGIALVYTGISGLWCSHHEKNHRDRIIDVEYRED